MVQVCTLLHVVARRVTICHVSRDAAAHDARAGINQWNSCGMNKSLYF